MLKTFGLRQGWGSAWWLRDLLRQPDAGMKVIATAAKRG
jgi:hypothetical protein